MHSELQDELLELSDALDSKLDICSQYIFVFIFSIVIVLGLFGNLLVACTVLFNKHMRTSNNILILNLAVSDITLCVFSIPFMALKVLFHTWPYGKLMCHFVSFYQATNVFTSTFTIVTIAVYRWVFWTLDSWFFSIQFPIWNFHIRWRYVKVVYLKTIYHGRKNSIERLVSNRVLIILPCIWSLSCIISAPMFIFIKVQQLSINVNPFNDNSMGKKDAFVDHSHSTQQNLYYCIEDWPNSHARLIYSYVSLFVQYVIPILVVCCIHVQIWRKLKNHDKNLRWLYHPKSSPTKSNTKPVNQLLSHVDNQHVVTSCVSTMVDTCQFSHYMNLTHEKKKHRLLKMNGLLILIAVVFGVSWLPLNAFNVFSDSNSNRIKPDSRFYIVNSVCILFAMSSSISNPFLYGILNANFKKEYVKLYRRLKANIRFCCQCPRNSS